MKASWFGLDLLATFTTIFSLAYGVYAVVTDFHETKSGKRALSRAGRVGVALLIASAVLNMSVDFFKKRQDDKRRSAVAVQEQQTITLLNESVRDAEDLGTRLISTQRQLDRASSDIKSAAQTTDAVLHSTRSVYSETKRSQVPLSDLEVDVEVAIPLSQGFFASYGERLKRETAPSVLSVRSAGHWVTQKVDERLRAMITQEGLLQDSELYRLDLLQDSILMPTEEEHTANLFVHGKCRLYLRFYRTQFQRVLADTSDNLIPDLEMVVTQPELAQSNAPYFPGIQYAPSARTIIIRFGGTPEITRQSHEFISMLDFANSIVDLWVGCDASGSSSDAGTILIPTARLHNGKGYSVLLGRNNCKQSSDRAARVCKIQSLSYQ